MAKKKDNSFKKAADLYDDVRSASQSYESMKPIAEFPLVASKIARKEGDKVAAKYLLDRDTPDYLKLPFIKEDVRKQMKELSDYVDGNFDNILRHAPKKSLVKALTFMDPNEKLRIVADYYNKQYTDEEDEDLRDAFIQLYASVEGALNEKYIEIVTKDKDTAGVASYVSKLIPNKPEVRMAFFQALFAKEREE